MKVYIVGGQSYSEYMDWIDDAKKVNDVERADIVLFCGGEDVSPIMYGEIQGTFTHCNYNRDIRERYMFETALKQGKHMLGICRGAQFLCVMAGGRLVQHQDNPKYIHSIRTWDKEDYMITSSHHQAQYVLDMPEPNYRLIGWTTDTSPFHLDGNDKEICEGVFKEVEIASYPKIKALCIQGHPEYPEMKRYPETNKYLNSLVKDLVNNVL